MTFHRSISIWLLTVLLFVLVTSQIRGEDVCSPSHVANCSCYTNAANQNTVGCSEKALIRVPESFSPNTSIIILSKNQITEVTVGPFNYVTELIDLYLQDNYISYIQPGAFSLLMNMQQIILANNYIRSISSDVFSHLPSLSVLDLSNNLITTVDRYSFFYLPSLVLVNLKTNPLSCGCEEKLLKEFLDLRLGSLSLSNARCVNFGNISITDVSQASWTSVTDCEGETLFRPRDTNMCYTCADAKGIVDCQTEDKLQQCFGEKMSNITTDETLTLCTKTNNETCWNQQVALMNGVHAEQMTPVIVMMALFMVVGTLGNSVVIVMYRSKKQKTSANIFIMFLAGIDLFACVVIHPYIIFKLFFFYNQTWLIACKIFEFLLHFNLLLSSMTLMLIAVDRFLAICRPVKYLKFDRHIMKSVVTTCILAFVTSIPILEFYGPSPLGLKVADGLFVGYICHYQQRYLGSTSMAFFSGFIMTGFVIQIVATAILYKQVAVVAYRSRRAIGPTCNSRALAGFRPKTSLNGVNQSNTTNSSLLRPQLNDVTPCSSKDYLKTSQRKDMTTAHGSKLSDSENIFCVQKPSPLDKKCTTSTAVNNHATNSHGQSIGQLKARRLKAAKILFLVTIVFVLSWMPFFVLRICNAGGNGACLPVSYLGQIVDCMLNHVFYINNAINPILYTIINKTFRDEFQSILRRRFRCNA